MKGKVHQAFLGYIISTWQAILDMKIICKLLLSRICKLLLSRDLVSWYLNIMKAVGFFAGEQGRGREDEIISS